MQMRISKIPLFFVLFGTFFSVANINHKATQWHSICQFKQTLETLPASKAAFSFPCSPAAGILSALGAGLAGGAAALRMP